MSELKPILMLGTGMVYIKSDVDKVLAEKDRLIAELKSKAPIPMGATVRQATDYSGSAPCHLPKRQGRVSAVQRGSQEFPGRRDCPMVGRRHGHLRRLDGGQVK